MKNKPEMITFRPSDKVWSILQSRVLKEKKRGQRPTLTSVIHEIVLEAHEVNKKRTSKATQGA